VSVVREPVAEGAERTSTRVLSEAARLFRERGYAASTTRELSARLGINKASLYYHISSKEDLLHGICIESLRRVQEEVTAALEAESEPRERIRALIRAHLHSMLTDLPMHSTMLLEGKALSGSKADEVQAARDEYEKVVFQTVSKAQRAGALRRDVKAKHLTLGLLNLLNWSMAWWNPDGQLTPGELADILSDLYLNGAGSD
jgi:TetR/AcrR family transcriptional regulator, cholesterol catabolism regulator